MNRINISRGRRAKKNSNKVKITLGIIFLIIILIAIIIFKFNIFKQNNNATPQESNTSEQENTIQVKLEEDEPKTDEIVSVSDMPNKMGSYTVEGKIVIDKINVEKYILDRPTVNSLNLAVTKFAGPEINDVGNYCITGHNYKNIFRELRKLNVGDEFYLVGKDGRKVTYVIYDKFTINPEDESCLNQETEGKREVTLITCSPGAITRLILKAEEKI